MQLTKEEAQNLINYYRQEVDKLDNKILLLNTRIDKLNDYLDNPKDRMVENVGN